MPFQNGHRNMIPARRALNRMRKNLSQLFLLETIKKKTSVRETYFGMPHDKIFAAYTKIKPLSYIDSLSLHEALKFIQYYLKVHLQRNRSWCKSIKGPIFQHADFIEISLNSLETGVILQFLENV